MTTSPQLNLPDLLHDLHCDERHRPFAVIGYFRDLEDDLYKGRPVMQWKQTCADCNAKTLADYSDNKLIRLKRVRGDLSLDELTEEDNV